MKKLLVGGLVATSLILLPQTASASAFTDFLSALFGGTQSTVSRDNMPLVCGPLGDVNGDGKISQVDVNLLSFLAEGATTSDTQRVAADVNKDGVLDNEDFTALDSYISGNSSTLSGCNPGRSSSLPANVDTSNPFISNASARVLAPYVIDKNAPSQGVSLTFRLNAGKNSLYVSADPKIALTYVTLPADSHTQFHTNLVSTEPGTLAGDKDINRTGGFYMIPAGSSRVFNYIGDLINDNGTPGLKSLQVTAIKYGTSPASLENNFISAGTEPMRVLTSFGGKASDTSVTPVGGVVVSPDPHSPLTSTVAISRTTSTQVLLGVYDIKIQNTGGTLRAVNIKLSIGEKDRPASEVIENMQLGINGKMYSAYAIRSDAPHTISFVSLNQPLPADVTVPVKIYATILPNKNNSLNGVTLSTTFEARNEGQIHNPLIERPDTSPIWVESHTIASNKITLFSDNTSATQAISLSNIVTAGGQVITPNTGIWLAAYPSISFTITNPGSNPIYISKTGNIALLTTTSSGPAASSTITATVASGSTSGDTSDSYIINGSRTFTYNFYVDNTNGSSAAKKLSLTQINYGTGPGSANNDLHINSGLQIAYVLVPGGGGSFSPVTEDANSSTITIHSPKAGDTIKYGNSFTVKYSIGYDTDSLKVFLYNTATGLVHTSPSFKGRADDLINDDVNIATGASLSGQIPTGRYFVKICDVSKSLCSQSDTFSIVNSTATTTTITTPNQRVNPTPTPSPLSEVAFPDLQILGVTCIPSLITTETNIYCSVHVYNNSDVAVARPFNVSFGGVSVSIPYIGARAQMTSAVPTSSFRLQGVGTTYVRFAVDAENVIREADENNNVYTKDFVVQASGSISNTSPTPISYPSPTPVYSSSPSPLPPPPSSTSLQTASSRAADIRNLYVTLLQREPDQGGFDYFYYSTMSIDTIRSMFLNSQEYQNLNNRTSSTPSSSPSPISQGVSSQRSTVAAVLYSIGSWLDAILGY